MDYDVVVIGGGAAGLAAARTAQSKKARVVMVTDGPVGGDCTFVGCIPSKTLIAAAARGDDFVTAMQAVRATVADVAAAETAEVLRAEGIDVIEGRARLAGREGVDVDGRHVSCSHVIVAVGARPAVPPIPGLSDIDVLTNENIFDLTDAPASLLVVGGGPIGIELAQAFARLGVTVTVVEAANRLLPQEEPEAAAVVARALSADRVGIVTGRHVTAVIAGGAELDDGTTLTGARILVAVGRRPATEDGGLAEAGAALDERGWIVTDRHLRTTLAGVYAAGDVTGRSGHTHAADEMGRIAATNALSRVPYRTFRGDRIPAVTFTDPEVARVGVTEDTAARTVPGARVAYLPLTAVDRGVTAGRTDGYIKLITGPRRVAGRLAGGRIIGATIVAPHAGEMIALPTLAMATGMFPARLALTVQAYPTWTLGVRQAAAQYFVETAGRRARPAAPDLAEPGPCPPCTSAPRRLGSD